MHACTVLTRSYLAHARVLTRSFLKQHPESTFDALVLDPGLPLDPTKEPFDVVIPGDLIAPEEWGPLWFAYSPVELSCAMKPLLLRHLLDRYGDTATYFDSDIRFYNPVGGLEDLSRRHGVVLTPHTCHPLPPDGRHPTDLDILRAGTYNLGLVSVGQQGRAFLDWWWQWLRRHCLVEPNRGLHADQRWVDLAPAFFRCHILKDATTNVAYWNLHERDLLCSGDRYLVDGRPLTFFHFSGYDPNLPWLLTTHGTRPPRSALGEDPALRQLCDGYARELLAAGYDEVSDLSFDQVTLPNGVVLDRRARLVYRDAISAPRSPREGSEPPNPVTNPDELVAWLREPAVPAHPAWLSRYLAHFYNERADLRRRFPRVPGGDARRFLRWLHRQGADKTGIPEVFMPSASAARSPGLSRQPVGEGVNLVGYLRAEFGLGEGARQIAGALQALGVPLATYTYSPTSLQARQEHGFTELQPVSGLINPFDLNIVRINYSQIARFAREMGPGFFSGRYTVGAWAAELEEFPASWVGALDFVDEVWMNSEYAAVGLRKCTSKPIRVLPNPVRVPVSSGADRRSLGLPDNFLFLFVFDYNSTTRRKNPDGLVRAFKQAFTPGEGPILVVKSTNGHLHHQERERLRYEVGDRPDILLIEDYLSAGDKNALMACCDCYVSLHRSEGFGLTMAEAMALGKPTIATGYSGNLEFMTPENSFLVGFTRTQVPADAGHYPAGATWAEPDLDEAAALMRRVYTNPEAARQVGERARDDIIRLHGPEARARLLEQLLTQARAQWKQQKQTANPDAPPAPSHRERRNARSRSPQASQMYQAAVPPGAAPGQPGESGDKLLQAQRDLRWLLRWLHRPPLSWILASKRGYRVLRDRWLGDD
jgi:glycosyltransferase involved in cell wall biosynthesis